MTDSEKKDAPQTGGDGGTGPVDPIDRGRAWLAGIGGGALVVAALVVAFTIGTNYSDDPASVAPGGEAAEAGVDPLPEAASGPGRELFVSSCGACHALDDAGAEGTGSAPDLDSLAPDAALTEQAIAQGGTGSGMMPPGLLVGQDAKDVAEYVAAVTGGG